jgi:asparagine synthase (glutamine-hydrolysing)
MSGICGVWNLDGRPVETALLARLSARLAHRGSDAEGSWIEGAIGLACHLHRVTPQSSTETQPLLDSSGAVVVFDGRLDNREEVLASVERAPGITADAPDPTLVLATYQAFGDRFPERLNGDFALGLFDPGRRQLLLARDAIGIRPLYYARTPHSFLFASEIKALLAHPQLTPRPNDDHLAQYLLGGATCHGDAFTFIDGVSNLWPGHMVVLTPRGFRAHRYWDFDPSRQTRFGSFADYAEAFRHHFEQAVRRRLRSAYPVAVSVSGGVDSSAIFCLAETLRRRNPDRHPSLLGVSYISADGSPSDEAGFLAEIERAYGVAIERVPMDLGFLNRAREAVWHAEIPLMDEQWNTTHAFLSTVRRLGARLILTGHWADQMLFDQAYLVDLFRRLAWGEIRAHLTEYGRWYTDADPRYFRRRFVLDLVTDHAPSGLVSWLRRLRAKRRLPWYADTLRKRAGRRASLQTAVTGAFATAHAKSLYEEARSRYHVLCMEWENKVAAMYGLEMAFPFLDRDLLVFLMGIPGEMQTWKGVPKAILREAMRRVLPAAIRERRWKADFTQRVNDGMARDFPQLVHCLQSDGMAVRLGYVRKDAMRVEFERLKGRIQGPTSEISWSLSDLLGLELWLQLFLGKEDGLEGSELPEAKGSASVEGGSG